MPTVARCRTIPTACFGAVLTFFLGLVFFSRTDAATITAASPALADVTVAVASAVDGDTVVVPPGTASWTSTLTITKGIILQGASTVTTNGSPPTAYSVNDATIVEDDVARIGSNGGGALISVALSPSQSFRLTGFTFNPGSLTSLANNGAVRLTGTCPSARVDHCHFYNLYQGDQIHTFGQIYGVIDHCIFDCRGNPLTMSILVWHDGWGGQVNGNGSWADPPYFGTEKFLFIEDNVLSNFNAGATVGGVDAKLGARYVFRYNLCKNTKPNSHGTEGGAQRGVRVMEIYNNSFVFTVPGSGSQIRSGTAVLHDNVWTGPNHPSVLMDLDAYRMSFDYDVFGPANGNNPWDSNDPHGVYASGSHTGSNNAQTLTASGVNWLPDQWAGYSLTNTTTGQCSFIKSNTSNTITYFLSSGLVGQPMIFNYGDGFAIYKVLTVLDQPGRGQSDLVINGGSGPINSVTGISSWPHNASEPVYSWNNTINGHDVGVNATGYTIQEGRDYYNDTPMPGYTPYVYPHPLVSGVPGPPTGLRVVSGQ